MALSLSGQVQPAPTVAQCQVDQRLWRLEMEDAHPLAARNFKEFEEAKEMNACRKVDHANFNLYPAESQAGRVETTHTSQT